MPRSNARPSDPGPRPPMLAEWSFLCLVLLIATSNAALAATPQGPEFRVNTTVADSQNVTLGTQHGRAVSSGGFGSIVVWQSSLQDSSGYGVFGQRYNLSGQPVGGEFQINQSTTGFQGLPAVAANGGFVVVWSGDGPGDTAGVFARLYDVAGNPRGNEFGLNSTTAGVQSDPDVSMDNGDDFVVVWSGNGPADTQGIVTRLFNANGTPATGEIQVNSDSTGVQSRPAVTTDSNGDMVVVWESTSPAGEGDVYFRRLSNSGALQGTATLVHASTAGEQRNPTVGRRSNGSFVVAWENDPGTGDFDISMRRFGGSGAPQSPEARANSNTAGDQRHPFLFLDTNGKYVLAWSSDDDPTAAFDWNVRLRQFASDGTAVGAEVVANATTAGFQAFPSIVLEDVDEFVVVWEGNGPSDNHGVFGQFFGLAATADLSLLQSASDTTPLPGDTLAVTLTLTNNGPDIASNVLVSDLLPAGLTFLSDFSSQGNYDNGTGQWSIASMASAASEILRLTVRVDPGTQGASLVNTARILALDQIDPVPANNIATLTVTPVRSLLTVAASQTGRTLLPGQTPDAVFTLRMTSASTVAETLRAVTFTNTTSGPGTQAELDAAWGALQLRDAGGTTLATRSANGGRIVFDALALPIAPGDSIVLSVHGAPSLQARDGDVMDLGLATATDLVHTSPAAAQATWPLEPAGGFLVNGMSAAQIQVFHVSAPSFFAGTVGNLALDIVLPANGYEADRLEKLNLFSNGTAVHGTDIQALQVWVDDGDGVFQAALDRALGTLVFTGNRWELTGLAETVPVGGLRLFCTVQLAPTATVGRTLRLGLSSDPDVPIGMASGNDGPVDGSVSNRYSQSVGAADRVVFAAAQLSSAVVRPGAASVPFLQVAASNTYATPRTLTQLALTNATSTPNGGSMAQRDGAFEALRLVEDQDADGEPDAGEPVLATAFFSAGRASFEGLDWALPAGATRYLLVVSDVSLRSAADGDLLTVQAGSALDVSFLEPTAIAASWPLDSGAVRRVDGMVAAQLTSFGATGVTLGPNEGPALGLDLQVPANGYADDILQGLSVVNLGTASAADLAELRLWRDGGDGLFTPGSGDDAEIAPLVLVDGSWKSPQLSEPIGPAGLRVFVGATVAAAPQDSVTLQLGVPLQGIQVASGNDGPLDLPLQNPEALLFSTAPLSVTITVPPQSNLGQVFQVSMSVRNASAETIQGITPSALVVSGDAGVVLIAPPGGTAPLLDPGAQVSFLWTLSGTSVGSVQFTGGAEGIGVPSGLVRRSLAARSGSHRILQRAASLAVEAVGSVPFSVNRGETNVVPLSLTFSHDGDASTSDIELRDLRLRLEDDSGSGIVPAAILSRLVLREGSHSYYASSLLPATGDEIALALSPPLKITPDQPATVSVQIDILATTVVPAFRFAIVDAAALGAHDVTDGTAVVVHPEQGSYPLLSGTGLVRSAPTQLDVVALPASAQTAGRGQAGVALLGLCLANPGVPNLTTSIRVVALQLCITDTAGAALGDPGRFFRNLRLKSGALTLDERNLAADTDSTIRFTLSTPVLVPAGGSSDLHILGDVSADAALGSYRLRLQTPSSFEARDDNTLVRVPAVYAVEPLQSAALAIEARAESLRVRATPSFPPSLTVGERGRTALVATLRHPGTPGTGRIAIHSLSVQCRDEARRPLSMAAYLDEVRVLIAGEEMGSETVFPASGGVSIPLATILIAPGEQIPYVFDVDIEATSPTTFFELLVTGFSANDENLGTAVTLVPEAGDEMPLSSGLTKLSAPATELVVGLQSRMPAVLAPDGSNVALAQLTLRNTAPTGAGGLQVDRLVLRASDRNATPLALGQAAAQILVRQAGNVVLQSAALDADSSTVTLVAAPPLVVAAGTALQLDVFASFQPAPGADGFRLGVDAADIHVLQPTSTVLPIRILSEAGQMFPLWTEPGSFGTASLRESFANFPNPFGAEQQATTFTYFLPQPGRVTLRILSPRGEAVATLLDGAQRAAGLHQSEIWNGRNARDRGVLNGVYIAELRVHLDDGTQERVLRKVAVVR